mmetsp:Transcript_19695/g.35643  ORF Transcript_19695/g.35643 Transcript_19695/m.35643 type:complete len:543 (-) Transcript_19695:53-1681(-)
MRSFPGITLLVLLQNAAVLRSEADPGWSFRLPAIAPTDAVQLFQADLEIGSPRQTVRVKLDTGSTFSWVPDRVASPDTGLEANISRPGHSTTLQLHDKIPSQVTRSFRASGWAAQDTIQLKGESLSAMQGERWPALLQAAPFMLVDNLQDTQSVASKYGEMGVLGFAVPPPRTSSGFSLFGGSKSKEEEPLLSPMERLFNQGVDVDAGGGVYSVAKVAPQFRFSLASPTPHVDIGKCGVDEREDAKEIRAPMGPDGSWYVLVRAIGVSSPQSSSSSPEIIGSKGSIDFNSLYPLGTTALLDSGSSSITVSSRIFQAIKNALPSKYKCDTPNEVRKVIECKSCPEPDKLDTEFPSISISFETADNIRLFGLDFGSDMLICLPPRVFVTPMDGGQCMLNFLDGSEGLAEIVLGVPFFRAVDVVFDTAEHSLWFTRSNGAQLIKDGPSTAKCNCADPKNWFNTGQRFSSGRVTVVLTLACFIYLCIYIGYSDSADGIRRQVLGQSGNAIGGAAVNMDVRHARNMALNRGGNADGGGHFQEMERLS